MSRPRTSRLDDRRRLLAGRTQGHHVAHRGRRGPGIWSSTWTRSSMSSARTLASMTVGVCSLAGAQGHHVAHRGRRGPGIWSSTWTRLDEQCPHARLDDRWRLLAGRRPGPPRRPPRPSRPRHQTAVKRPFFSSQHSTGIAPEAIPHYLTYRQETTQPLVLQGVAKWRISGSNRRPFECHSNALPTELIPRRKWPAATRAGIIIPAFARQDEPTSKLSARGPRVNKVSAEFHGWSRNYSLFGVA